PVKPSNITNHTPHTLQKKPIITHNIDEIFSVIGEKMDIPIKDWIANCRALKELLYQRELSSYVGRQ
ncbi:MAG: hypothetical protein QW194_02495, partial [Candidatus Micrarchaeaceae archaeon]